jgi:tetraacyldisaccharide 4'-kinase
LLLPLGLIWGTIAQIKRSIYSLFKWSSRPAPISIVIGNINVGGLGKTPTLIWIFKQLVDLGLPPQTIGVLSRGYGRKSKGFVAVDQTQNASTVGDEPLEILQDIENQVNLSIPFAVCENRPMGIGMLKAKNPDLQIVLLDDGFQHLKLNHHASILLCDYHNSFTNDLPLPAGNLREFPFASNTAKTILVTNCPPNLTEKEATLFKTNLSKQMANWNLLGQFFILKQKTPLWENNVGFLSNKTSNPLHHHNHETLTSGAKIMLITGIAKPHRMASQLTNFSILEHIQFPDHHNFTQENINRLMAKFNDFVRQFPEAVIVTTRKDYFRLQSLNGITKTLPLFLVHVEIHPLFNTQELINSTLKNILHENTIN